MFPNVRAVENAGRTAVIINVAENHLRQARIILTVEEAVKLATDILVSVNVVTQEAKSQEKARQKFAGYATDGN